MIYDEKPWLKSYDPDVDPEVSIPDLSLSEILGNTFKESQDRLAFHYMGMSMTFGELFEQSGHFAAGLQNQGLGKGDVVAINLPNVPQYLVAVIGSLRAGCAVSGVSPLLMPDEMTYQLNDCSAKVLVILDSLFEAKFASAADQVSSVERVLVTGPADYLGNAVTDSQMQPLANKHVTAFMDFLQQGPGEPSQVSCSPADACFIQYTGGTTGPSKGAILTHRNIVANKTMFEHWMKFERGKEVWLTAFPLFHIAGLFLSSCALTLGNTQILIPNPRDLDHIIKECDQKKPVFFGNVPSLYLMLLGKEEFRQLDFSGLRYCMSGAAPFPVDAIKDLESIVGEGKIGEVWGMTETSPLITVIPSRGKKKFGSVGLPLPSTSLRVVDLIDGESPVPLGEEGELICSGPQVMSEYLNKPEETKAALREHDGRVWMHTGDIGKMDEDGFVYVVDRLKDMIIVGGFKVFSSEVEDKFYQHPAVGMCALIGVPNPERPGNEIVKLVLQKSEAFKDKPDDEVEAELLAFAKEKLAPYKVPKIFEFVDAVPTTSIGKVDKKAIRK